MQKSSFSPDIKMSDASLLFFMYLFGSSAATGADSYIIAMRASQMKHFFLTFKAQTVHIDLQNSNSKEFCQNRIMYLSKHFFANAFHGSGCILNISKRKQFHGKTSLSFFRKS